MKIGIFTHYYLSDNYGGNLQAYALCKVLRNIGHETFQICYRREIINRANLFQKFFCFFRYRLKRTIVSLCERDFYNKICERKKAILEFNQHSVPHSTKIYDDSTLSELNDEFDMFVTGSDQVWHPNVLCSGFLLEFCHDSKKKTSYAASIATTKVDEESKIRIRKALESFSHISVRENDSLKILSDMGICNCEWVLDPTLLLTADDWRTISKPLALTQNYVLTYFLGENEVSRRYATEYATRNNLQLVSLPYLLNQYRKCDKNFGDVQLFAVSPEQLIYLIDHANTVFTDSFHATVFSIIFKKNFYVFKRNNSDKMTNRIQSLLEIFDFSERFITEDSEYDDIFYEAIHYTDSVEYELMREKSYKFLYDALNTTIEK